MLKAPHHPGLVPPAKRRDHPHPGQPTKIPKESRRRIPERIVSQRPQCNHGNAPLLAKHRRQRQQQQVPPRQVHRRVRRPRARRIAPGQTPVPSQQTANRQFEHRQRSMPQPRRAQEPPQPPQFGRLPDETLPDIERIDAPILCGQMSQQRATIQPATDQRAHGGLHLPCRTSSFFRSHSSRNFCTARRK